MKDMKKKRYLLCHRNLSNEIATFLLKQFYPQKWRQNRLYEFMRLLSLVSLDPTSFFSIFRVTYKHGHSRQGRRNVRGWLRFVLTVFLQLQFVVVAINFEQPSLCWHWFVKYCQTSPRKQKNQNCGKLMRNFLLGVPTNF